MKMFVASEPRSVNAHKRRRGLTAAPPPFNCWLQRQNPAMSDYYPKCAPDVQCPHCNPQRNANEQSSLAAMPGSASWRVCPKCGTTKMGEMHRSGIYIPGCEHDSKERRVYQLLKEIEEHCPCGARPESLNTHSHVCGCPVELALRMMTPNSGYMPGRRFANSWASRRQHFLNIWEL